MLVNSYLYLVLELISPELLADSEYLLNYFQLLDYLLTQETENKKISPLLYPIVIDLNIKPYSSLLDRYLPVFPQKLAQFKLRYIIHPESIKTICDSNLQSIWAQSE